MDYVVSLHDETIEKLGEAISGGVDVVALQVTENGEYVAPEGKAYSPVNVNVAGVRYANITFTLTNNSTADVFIGCPNVIEIEEGVMLFQGVSLYLPAGQEAYYEMRLPIFTNLMALSYQGIGGTTSQDVDVNITEGESDYALSYVGGAITIELLNDNTGDLAFTVVVTDNQ